MIPARLILVIIEHAAEQRLYSQKRKEAGRGLTALQPFRAIYPCKILVLGVDGRDFFKQVPLLAVIDVVGHGGGGQPRGEVVGRVGTAAMVIFLPWRSCTYSAAVMIGSHTPSRHNST